VGFWLASLLSAHLVGALVPPAAVADGKLARPRRYQGSLEERAQEAIIVFHSSDKPGEAVEDLILKITVVGETDKFAWIIPFPNNPEVKQEPAALFQELYDYVEARLARAAPAQGTKSADDRQDAAPKSDTPVDVLQRKTVGSYDVAVVKENKVGALKDWLTAEGFETLDGPGDVEIVEFYRRKGYVFACVKVQDAGLAQHKQADLHPLRFTFKTGGRDAIYFPMKMSAMQFQSFDVNLYVFYRYWLNKDLNQYGYVHRGFDLKYRDWDSPKCQPDGGKGYASPESDPLLASLAHKLPTVKKMFEKRYPGRRFYMTNLQAVDLSPADLREWPDDLWLFPHYTNRKFIPYDARPGGVAAAAWADAESGKDAADEADDSSDDEEARSDESAAGWGLSPGTARTLAVGLILAALLAAAALIAARSRKSTRSCRT
jgi:hypothetical protein